MMHVKSSVFLLNKTTELAIPSNESLLQLPYVTQLTQLAARLTHSCVILSLAMPWCKKCKTILRHSNSAKNTFDKDCKFARAYCRVSHIHATTIAFFLLFHRCNWKIDIFNLTVLSSRIGGGSILLPKLHRHVVPKQFTSTLDWLLQGIGQQYHNSLHF